MNNRTTTISDPDNETARFGEIIVNSVPAAPAVPVSVLGQLVPAVPVSGSGSVPALPCSLVAVFFFDSGDNF